MRWKNTSVFVEDGKAAVIVMPTVALRALQAWQGGFALKVGHRGTHSHMKQQKKNMFSATRLAYGLMNEWEVTVRTRTTSRRKHISARGRAVKCV